ncbi:MAG: alpha/beta hydrolase [Gammaproteobacteria bacterium]|nr:alpha/beta hydrolase [Gammaproteobacteria bacterium]
MRSGRNGSCRSPASAGSNSPARSAGGEGHDPVLLIHGYTGNQRNWALTVPTLVEAGYRTLSADNPGHGDSSAPETFEPYALERVAESLHGLAEGLDALPSVVIGHSMGGAIAEEYAIAHREDVRALVLVASAGGASGPEREDLSEDMEALRAACNEGGMEAVFDRLVAHGKRPEAAQTTATRREMLRREFARTSFAGCEFGALALRTRRDTLNDLATLDLPTLVVRGEHESASLTQGERRPGDHHSRRPPRGHPRRRPQPPVRDPGSLQPHPAGVPGGLLRKLSQGSAPSIPRAAAEAVETGLQEVARPAAGAPFRCRTREGVEGPAPDAGPDGLSARTDSCA